MIRSIEFKILFCIICFISFSAKVQGSDLVKPVKDDTELNSIVETLVLQAKDQSRLADFKALKRMVSEPFSSTPLFLQTLESLKLLEEKKKEVFARFLPRVTSSVGGGIKSGGFNNDRSSQSYSLNINQLVFDFGVTKRQYNASKKEEVSNQAKIDNQRTELLLQIISTVHEVYRAKTLLLLSQGFVDTRNGFLESMRQREALGGSSNADVIRAETKLSDALDKIPLQVKSLKDNKSKLAEFFGTKIPEVRLTQLPIIDSKTFDVTEDTLSRNFKIREMTNQVDAAKLNFQAEKRGGFGRFNLQAGYQNTDTNLLSPQEQSSLLLTYQLDIFTGFEKASKVSQAGFRVNALNFELERIKRELVTELEQSVHAFDAHAALVLSRSELVKGAKLSNRVNKELFELNKASINDLFRSQEEYLNAAKNLVDAMVDKNINYYKMLASFGLLLETFDLGA
ncbi:MAG: hypothetical protein CMK54_05490 [Proteobacteria bacterium]|nr:hypothetical protein [Pseudomonadota bacterium]